MTTLTLDLQQALCIDNTAQGLYTNTQLIHSRALLIGLTLTIERVFDNYQAAAQWLQEEYFESSVIFPSGYFRLFSPTNTDTVASISYLLGADPDASTPNFDACMTTTPDGETILTILLGQLDYEGSDEDELLATAQELSAGIEIGLFKSIAQFNLRK